MKEWQKLKRRNKRRTKKRNGGSHENRLFRSFHQYFDNEFMSNNLGKRVSEYNKNV